MLQDINPCCCVLVHQPRLIWFLLEDIGSCSECACSCSAAECTACVRCLKVLKALSPGERVVLLDERGRAATSEDIARLISHAGDNGTPLAFVVGGPFGHGQAVVDRADDSVRLSSMVLNHQVAYVVLLEQLYRGWTIIKGEPYHH